MVQLDRVAQPVAIPQIPQLKRTDTKTFGIQREVQAPKIQLQYLYVPQHARPILESVATLMRLVEVQSVALDHRLLVEGSQAAHGTQIARLVRLPLKPLPQPHFIKITHFIPGWPLQVSVLHFFK
jgi:hypothetical protein